MLRGALNEGNTRDNWTNKDSMNGRKEFSKDSLDMKKVVISTKRKAVNCARDEEDIYSFRSR